MNIALVLSGGVGTRLGTDIPKQYMEVNGRRIISYCLKTLFCHEAVDAIQIVAEEPWQQAVTEEIDDMVRKGDIGVDDRRKFRGFSVPGITRQLSVLHGLEDILSYACADDLVLIHDAARPLLSANLVSECFRTMEGQDGVLPVLPMKDTVYFSEDGEGISSLLERKRIFAGQAPECFVFGKYYEANQVLLPEKILEINGSTEPAVLAGMKIKMIPGDEKNFKITTKADLERFCKYEGMGAS